MCTMKEANVSMASCNHAICDENSSSETFQAYQLPRCTINHALPLKRNFTNFDLSSVPDLLSQ